MDVTNQQSAPVNPDATIRVSAPMSAQSAASETGYHPVRFTSKDVNFPGKQDLNVIRRKCLVNEALLLIVYYLLHLQRHLYFLYYMISL